MERHLTWEAYEHEPRERGSDWYWAVSIIALAIAVTAVLFQNILLAVFIILSAFSLMMLSARHPQLMQFSLTDTGIQIGKTLYEYASLESYWLDDSMPGRPQILIKSKKTLMPLLVIPLGGTDPDAVQAILQHYISKSELHEPLTQKIMEYLGF